MLTVDERRNILAQPNLSIKDVELLEGVSSTTARKIMNQCRHAFDGEVPANCHKITTESYLKYNKAPVDYLEILLMRKDKDGKDYLDKYCQCKRLS